MNKSNLAWTRLYTRTFFLALNLRFLLSVWTEPGPSFTCKGFYCSALFETFIFSRTCIDLFNVSYLRSVYGLVAAFEISFRHCSDPGRERGVRFRQRFLFPSLHCHFIYVNSDLWEIQTRAAWFWIFRRRVTWLGTGIFITHLKKESGSERRNKNQFLFL